MTSSDGRVVGQTVAGEVGQGVLEVRDHLLSVSLIVCTYKRPIPLSTLLRSVQAQSLQPFEILVVDGSPDDATECALAEAGFDLPLRYFRVPPEERGLTRQRNFGIARVSSRADIIAFLDDDTTLELNYFYELTGTYLAHPDAVGVGGYITGEVVWRKLDRGELGRSDEFTFDGWARKEDQRNLFRRRLGLAPDTPPCIMPTYSHGRSVSSIPPSGKTYPAEYFMGGVASYRRNLFDSVAFSHYFEGYGLYEDLDFTIRASRQGMLYINTAAQVQHHHAPDGRPNRFAYGKMVVRNGWYVWRVRYPDPPLSGKVKWWMISILLAGIRALNALSGSNRLAALTESAGRFVGMGSILVNKPRPEIVIRS